MDNYATADLSTANAGTATDKFMTPYLVEQRVKPVRDSLNTHIADKANPHATTKAQVGLGNVDNYLTATQAEAEAGTATDRFMTPVRVTNMIDKRLGSALTNYDGRYVRKSVGEDTSLTVRNGALYAWVSGGWRQVWPPQWQ